MTEGLKSEALFLKSIFLRKSLRVVLRQPTSLYKGGCFPQKDGRRVRVSPNKFIYTKKAQRKNPCAFSGAEGETRTLAPVTRPTPLAGAPRHQLEYFCMVTYIIKFCCCRWRREWDSNPRYVAVRRFSRPFRYNHFGISPY